MIPTGQVEVDRLLPPDPITKALALARIGCAVLPVMSDKKPASGWGVTRASTDPQVVVDAFVETAAPHVGVAMGASGLVAMDVDQHEGGANGEESLAGLDVEVPTTWEHTSMSGRGRHVVFAAPPGAAPHVLAAGIDIKAGNGYIVWGGAVPSSREAFAPAPMWTVKPERAASIELEPQALVDWLEGNPGTPDGVLAQALLRLPEYASESWSNNNLVSLALPLVSAARYCRGGAAARQEFVDRYATGKWATVEYRRDAERAFEKAISIAGSLSLADLPTDVEARFGDGGAVRTEDVGAADERAFWISRPVLQSLHANARRLTVSPWALLGEALLRALQTIPPDVPYQSYRGPAALNLAAVLLGPTGAGKSIIASALDQCLPLIGPGGGIANFYAVEVGSGEAIAEQYARRAGRGDESDADGDGLVWTRRAVAFSFDEVGRLEKLGARQGATVLEYTKTAISGGRLGRALAGRGGVELPKDSYRFTATIAAQPERCEVLLNADEVAGGLPGRLLWFSSVDPLARKERDRSPVEPFAVKTVAWEAAKAIRALPVMDDAHEESTLAAHEGSCDPLEGHEGLARAKVAVALARLDSRPYLTQEDWELSGSVMGHSRRTRSVAIAALAARSERSATARGRLEGVRAAVMDDARDERLRGRTRANVVRLVDEGVTDRREIRNHLSRPQRDYLDDVMGELGIAA